MPKSTEISVALVAKVHNLSAVEDIASINVLRLERLGITRIDNLEVFSQIQELHLAQNAIQRLENLDFLSNLRFLDVSFNEISSESLRATFNNLPPNLESINLTGNPCVNDEELLALIQDALPALGIIIGEYNDEEIASLRQGDAVKSSAKLSIHREGEDEDGGEEDEVSAGKVAAGALVQDSRAPRTDGEGEDEGNTDPSPSRGVLDADTVLRSIVERKCKLQNMPQIFDMDATISKLNLECDEVLAEVRGRGARERSKVAAWAGNIVDGVENEGQLKISTDGIGDMIGGMKSPQNVSRGLVASPSNGSTTPGVSSALFGPNMQQRIDSMILSSRQHTVDSRDFMSSLRERATKARLARLSLQEASKAES